MTNEEIKAAYLAPHGFVEQLRGELAGPIGEVGHLLTSSTPAQHVVWAQNKWLEPQVFSFSSIRDAANKLRAIQRNWVLYPSRLVRRARLIEELLPPIKTKAISYFAVPPHAPLGSWTLLDANTLLASAHCSSPYPHGELHFLEDKSGPPNRAYLKLWETFTRLQIRPTSSERCVDLGASPGGWTWVLQATGAQVLAVDKAPLDKRIADLRGVDFLCQSAFSLQPHEVGPIDWLFSDVVCYPKRLLSLVRRFLESGTCRNMVCTVKFQGDTDYDVIKEFAAIEGSQLIHLFHNKHELTWIYLGDSGTAVPK